MLAPCKENWLQVRTSSQHVTMFRGHEIIKVLRVLMGGNLGCSSTQLKNIN